MKRITYLRILTWNVYFPFILNRVDYLSETKHLVFVVAMFSSFWSSHHSFHFLFDNLFPGHRPNQSSLECELDRRECTGKFRFPQCIRWWRRWPQCGFGHWTVSSVSFWILTLLAIMFLPATPVHLSMGFVSPHARFTYWLNSFVDGLVHLSME